MHYIPAPENPEETALIQHIEMLENAHRKMLMPYYDRLARMRELRIPALILTAAEAESLGLTL